MYCSYYNLAVAGVVAVDAVVGNYAAGVADSAVVDFAVAAGIAFDFDVGQLLVLCPLGMSCFFP